jgi:hypothetical protein
MHRNEKILFLIPKSMISELFFEATITYIHVCPAEIVRGKERTNKCLATHMCIINDNLLKLQSRLFTTFDSILSLFNVYTFTYHSSQNSVILTTISEVDSYVCAANYLPSNRILSLHFEECIPFYPLLAPFFSCHPFAVSLHPPKIETQLAGAKNPNVLIIIPSNGPPVKTCFPSR